MRTSLVPVLLAVVAMTTCVTMVTGQAPTESEMQNVVAQAKIAAESAHEENCPCGGEMSRPLQALEAEHHSTPMSVQLSQCATVLEKVIEHFLQRNFTLASLSRVVSRFITLVCDRSSMQAITCPSTATPEFRSADGRCNNRAHPLRGSAEQPFKRLLPPAYSDGFKAPRSTGRNGAPLPSARVVSSTVHQHTRTTTSVNTNMVMAFGQFLDHDITLTPNFAEEGLVCHCECDQDERCFNIPVPPNDPDFTRPCLEFARSSSAPNEGCRMGPRQQLNEITAFVDASNVYGSSEEDMDALRGPSKPLYHAAWLCSNLSLVWQGDTTINTPQSSGTCPSGFTRLKHNCFKAFPTVKDYSWQQKDCRMAGGFLAMPRDRATNDFLVSLKNQVSPSDEFHIGLDDRITEGQFRYADGTTIGSYTNWAPGEPSSSSSSKDCVSFVAGTSGKWKTKTCGSLRYICQVTLPPWAPPGGQANQGSNLARSRPTQQSSTYSSYRSSRAVDGNRRTSSANSYCTRTNRQLRPWWRVDLGTSQCIGNVVVYNRQDSGWEWLQLFELHVGDSPDVASNLKCGGNNVWTTNKASITVNCGGLKGRYVGVLLPKYEYLTVCEVEVYKADCSHVEARGLLKSRPNPADSHKKELLPSAEREEFKFNCEEFTGNATCSEAGDVRVNEQPGLTSMHTVFMREHNRIARQLSRLNPDWDDDRVFFETRKIVGALMQKILYGEHLPRVLGPAAMTKYGLTLTQSGFYSGYNANMDPTIANVFATAAFRWGHTLVPNLFGRATPDFNMDSLCPIQLAFGFFNPSHVSNNDQGGPDSILRGLTVQPPQGFDRFMVSSVSKYLFADPPESNRGFDLAALNIHRGRDHGLPGYNAWRVQCGLARANSFDQLAFEIPNSETRRRLELVYSHVDDIDLFTGGTAEQPVQGGVVGPTFACLNGLQFRDLRQGDRFWFENQGQFTAAQLAEIKKSSLARILCDNTDGTTHIQPDVFAQAGDDNERVACRDLLEMDLSRWQE